MLIINKIKKILDKLKEDLAAHKAENVSDGVHGMGTAASKDAQTSVTDETAGRLMQVGAFGLGAAVPLLEDADTVIASGIYRFDANTIGAPIAAHGFLWHNKRGDTYTANPAASQIAVQGSQIWFRVHQSGVWSEWREIYHTGKSGTGSGLDADLLDGKHAYELVHKYEINAYSNSDDADAYTEKPPVAVMELEDDGSLGWPFNYGLIVTYWASRDRAKQLAYEAGNVNAMYFRELHPANYPNWSEWRQVMTDADTVKTRVNNGQLEYYDGGEWKPVIAIGTKYYTANLEVSSPTVDQYYTIMNISGKGVLHNIYASCSYVYRLGLRITLDGVVYTVGAIPPNAENGNIARRISDDYDSLIFSPNVKFNSSCKVEVVHTVNSEIVRTSVDYSLL
ncbi:MAG: hypothetical protein H0Z40_01550 [Desulfotomaculum sp.]|nr:hypothetical protein [Desulfotomaculum sp.]